MKRTVFLRPAAQRDLERLADFLVEHYPQAASSMAAVLRSAILSLSEFPDRGRKGPYAGLRELVVPFGRSKYVVRYLVSDESVVIVRIWHGREQRPGS